MSRASAHQAIIERRWPGLWRSLAGAPLPRVVEGPTTSPSPTLVIDGIHLTSGYDRVAEARLQATAVPPGSARAWVYGLALGDLPRVLLSRSELQRLEVVVMSSAAAYQSLVWFDHSDWLEDPRVALALATGASRIQTPFAVAPACLKLATPEALRLRDGLVLALAAPYQRRHFEELETVLAARVAMNRPLLEADGDVASLFGSRVGGRAAVVAAGPTLAEGFGWLSRHRADLAVVAVSTALVPLQMHGIDPDMVVVVDHRPGVRRHLEGAEPGRLTATPLVYSTVVDPDVLRAWPGPRLTAYLENQDIDAACRDLPKGELFCSGTVTHVAVDLAVRLGVHEVTLLGVDLCYPDEYTHVAGAASRRARAGDRVGSVWVTSGQGERVPTETNMVGYLRDLEAYVAGHPEVRFRKRGRAGATVEGVAWIEEDDDAAAP